MISMFGTYGWTTTVNPQPIIEPNLITGVGHGKYRPFERDKTESYHKHKKKTARKMAKQSRRRNRR